MAGTGVSAREVDEIKAAMAAGFSEIKALMVRYEERTRELEIREARCQPLVYGRLDNVEEDLKAAKINLTDDLKAAKAILTEDMGTVKARLDALERWQEEMRWLKRTLNWVLGVLTALLITLLAAVATGQILLVPK